MQCVSPSFDLEGSVGIRNQILKTRFIWNGERKMRYFTDVERGDKEGGVCVCVGGGGGGRGIDKPLRIIIIAIFSQMLYRGVVGWTTCVPQ